MTACNSGRTPLTEHGFCPPLTEHVAELERALEQACRDLNQAHDELLRAQGCADPQNRDWPMWSPQANTIRWAESLLGKELGKRGRQP